MKNFLIRKLLESKLKNISETEKEKILSAFEKNPELFQKIALDLKAEMDKGKNQMDAFMEIAQKYQNDLKGIL
jgi:hypothetical protein